MQATIDVGPLKPARSAGADGIVRAPARVVGIGVSGVAWNTSYGVLAGLCVPTTHLSSGVRSAASWVVVRMS